MATLKYFRTPLSVENKASGQDFDPVTAADQLAETVIAQEIAARHPDHGLVGEEFGTRNAGARYTWVIDPIDGTRAYIMGSPMWGTLIGLLDQGQPIAGIMNQPFTGERFVSDGMTTELIERDGATRRLVTRRCPKLSDAIFATTHPDLFTTGQHKAVLGSVSQHARMSRYGGDCYNYCLLAAGFVDVILETGLKPYDIVALIPIIEAAGGRVTRWDGSAATDGGDVIACGDPELHAHLIDSFAKLAS